MMIHDDDDKQFYMLLVSHTPQKKARSKQRFEARSKQRFKDWLGAIIGSLVSHLLKKVIILVSDLPQT